MQPSPQPAPDGSNVRCVARHPIYDRSLTVIAYELLFRGFSSTEALVADPEAATSATIVNTFGEIGLESIVGNRTAFLNVTRPFLLDGFASLLPPHRFALELLEGTEPDERLLETLRQLRRDGHVIVLDDFVYDDSARPLLELADMVKLDVLAQTRDELQDHVRLLRPFGVELVAEKVETHEDFDFCRRMLGFDYYQGYFFCRPKTFQGTGFSSGRLTKLQLVSRLQDPNVEFKELAEIISRDIGLSYRVLRYVNSAFVSLARKLGSIHEAIVLVGQRNIRNWATLLLLSEIEIEPNELIVLATVRARMCELLARASGVEEGAAFTTGLFSVIDALADAPLEEILEQLPLSEEISAALLAGDGPLGEILQCVVAYEHGELNGKSPWLLERISPEQAYLEAIAWANETHGLVAAPS